MCTITSKEREGVREGERERERERERGGGGRGDLKGVHSKSECHIHCTCSPNDLE